MSCKKISFCIIYANFAPDFLEHTGRIPQELIDAVHKIDISVHMHNNLCNIYSCTIILFVVFLDKKAVKNAKVKEGRWKKCAYGGE